MKLQPIRTIPLRLAEEPEEELEAANLEEVLDDLAVDMAKGIREESLRRARTAEQKSREMDDKITRYNQSCGYHEVSQESHWESLRVHFGID